MIIYKKNFITMIELLISMALTAIILSTLLYFYQDIELLSMDMEKSQKKAFKRLYVQNRLNDVMSNIVSTTTQENDFYFFTSQDANGLLKPNNLSLVFTYNFGANRNFLFANHVLGRLYLDNDNNLSIATMPSPNQYGQIPNIPLKKEILLENVDSLSFSFYVPPQRNKVKKTENETNLNENDLIYNHWYSDWKHEKKLPAIVKIILKLKDQKEEITFVYPLTQSEFIIRYS